MWWRIILSIFHRINKPKAESRISPSTQFQNENQVKEGGREGGPGSLPPSSETTLFSPLLSRNDDT